MNTPQPVSATVPATGAAVAIAMTQPVAATEPTRAVVQPVAGTEPTRAVTMVQPVAATEPIMPDEAFVPLIEPDVPEEEPEIPATSVTVVSRSSGHITARSDPQVPMQIKHYVHEV